MGSLSVVLTALLYLLDLLPNNKLTDGYCFGDAGCTTNRSCCLGFCTRRLSCNGFCRNNWDCPNGQFCQATVHYCTTGCYDSKDCSTGYACVSSTCEKRWRHGSTNSKKEVPLEPFSNIEESSSILGLLIAGIVAMIFFAWICCQCFRFRLRRQELQFRSYGLDDSTPSPTQQHVCEHHYCRREGLSYYDTNSLSIETNRRSACRLSLDGPPRYSALFLGEATSPRTPPPTYDEALMIEQVTRDSCNDNSDQRTNVSIHLPSPQGIGTVV